MRTRTFQVDMVVRDNVNVHDARISTRKANVEKKILQNRDPDDVAWKLTNVECGEGMSGRTSEKTLRNVKCVNGVYVPFGWNRFWRSS